MQGVNLFRNHSPILAGMIIWLMIAADYDVAARRGGQAELIERYGVEQTERMLVSRVLVRKDVTTVFPSVFFSRVSAAGAGAARLTKVEHGVAALSADGQRVTFTPDKGYSGPAAVWFISSESKERDQQHALAIMVTDVPLVNLHLVQLPIRLELAATLQLYVVGELADRQQGLLPPSALRFESSNPAVATVSATGQMNGRAEGVGVVTATAQRLQAVTAFAVGVPKDTDQNGQLLYAFGIEVAPKGLALVAKVGQQQLTVSLPIRLRLDVDQSGAEKGAIYYVSDSNVVSVSKRGLVTAGQEGVATISIVNGPTSTVVPVQVYRPRPGPAILDHVGGVVRGDNGVLVSVLPHTFHGATSVNLAPIASDKLPLPIPKPFKVITAFQLDLGPGQLARPVQISLPRLLTEKRHRTVLFFRQTSLPNKDGVEIPLWMQEARGIIGPDHAIHTDALQSPGIRFSGTYAVVVADPAQSGAVQGHVSYFFPVSPASTFSIMALVGNKSPIGSWVGAQREFEMILGIGDVTLKALEITSQGFVAEATTNVTVQAADKDLRTRRNRDREISIQLINQYARDDNKDSPWGRPEIKTARLAKTEGRAELILEGERLVFANERAPAEKREGAHPSEVMVNFHMPGRKDPLPAKPLSGSTATRLRVEIPAGVILGLAEVSVTRPQWQRTASGWDRRIELTSKEENLEGDPHYYFVPDGDSHVAVLDLKTHTLIKRVHVGETSSHSRPRGVIIPMAYTGQEQRAYVALQKGRGIGVIDTELLEQVDLVPETPAIDGLPFEDGEPSQMVWCCPERYRDERLYVSDRRSGRIAVYQISPRSETFHQRLAWINVDPAPVGLGEMAVNGPRNRLYVVAPGGAGAKGGRTPGHILVIDINPDSPTYHQQIGRIAVDGNPIAIDAWVYSAGPTVFTTQTVDGAAIGVIQDDGGALEWKVSYMKFGQLLGVNEGRVLEGTSVKVVPVKTGQEQIKSYVVVAYATASPAPMGGVGVIEDPTGPNHRFVEITKVTQGSYPLLASDRFDEIYTLDQQNRTVGRLNRDEMVGAMRSAFQPPLGSMPLQERNPKIFSYSFDAGGVPHGVATAGALKIQLWVQ